MFSTKAPALFAVFWEETHLDSCSVSGACDMLSAATCSKDSVQPWCRVGCMQIRYFKNWDASVSLISKIEGGVVAASDARQTWSMNPGRAASMRRLYRANAKFQQAGVWVQVPFLLPSSPRQVPFAAVTSSGLADEAVLRAPLMPCFASDIVAKQPSCSDSETGALVP